MNGETIFAFETFAQKIYFATRKTKRMNAFARFKKETWCMDLAYVDKLAKDKVA